ncbi:MAG: peptide-methionine (S)-S-oxide reductase MsrA [Candidatus Nanohaloarchaea archaeon]|nr:peptide-methionine (S)-S-oxide reductase MsrA [Candidatus Nanohaloarchaea archaeon]
MTEEAVVGGGCFWCTGAAFRALDGVEDVTSGYAGGHTEDPSYQEVCTGETGHAEVVRVRYDEDELSFQDILDLLFRIHDPTTEDRQGPDVGSQYRSIVLYRDEDQRETAEAFIEEKQDEYADPIVTEVKELDTFYPAEKKHQDYFEKHPDDAYCSIHVPEKVEKAETFRTDG